MNNNFVLYILILFFVFNTYDFGDFKLLEIQPDNNVNIPYDALTTKERILRGAAILSPSHPLISYAIFIYLGFYLWDRNKKKKMIEKFESSRYRRRYY